MDLALLETSLGYSFEDKRLLTTALMHRTYVNEHQQDGLEDNQRLEFLGDTVVNGVVSLLLFRQFPAEREGVLTKMRAEIVSERGLARLARHLNLGSFIFLGRGEEQGGGRQKESILSDAFESLFGAVMLDSSHARAEEVLLSLIEVVLGELEDVAISDYKSALIEYCQGAYGAQPSIEIISEDGPEHDKVFVAQVVINDRILGQGAGRNKKQAAQMACREALQSLGR